MPVVDTIKELSYFLIPWVHVGYGLNCMPSTFDRLAALTIYSQDLQCFLFSASQCFVKKVNI